MKFIKRKNDIYSLNENVYLSEHAKEVIKTKMTSVVSDMQRKYGYNFVNQSKYNYETTKKYFLLALTQWFENKIDFANNWAELKLGQKLSIVLDNAMQRLVITALRNDNKECFVTFFIETKWMIWWDTFGIKKNLIFKNGTKIYFYEHGVQNYVPDRLSPSGIQNTWSTRKQVKFRYKKFVDIFLNIINEKEKK